MNSVNSQTTQVPDQISEQPQKPLSKFILAIIGLIFVIGIGFGGYYFGQQKATITPTPISVQTISTPIPTTDITVNWQIYTHKDYQYSIKIPPQFKIDDRFYPQIHFTRISSTNSIPEGGLEDINILLWDPPKKCNTDTECFDIIENTYQGTKNTGSKTEYGSVVSNISGKSIKGIESWIPIISQGEIVTPSSLTYEYPMSLNSKLFELKFVVSGYQTKDQAVTQKNLIDQILSTFRFDSVTTSKFTEKEIVSPTNISSSSIVIKYSLKSDWQTYTDDLAKFSLQYNTTPFQPYNMHQSLGNNEAGKNVYILSCNTPPNKEEVCMRDYTVRIYSNYHGESRREWMKNNVSNDPSCQRYYSDVSVAGKNALLSTSDCSSFGETFILIPNGSQMIVFTTDGYSRNNTTGKITLDESMTNTLSTFKFL